MNDLDLCLCGVIRRDHPGRWPAHRFLLVGRLEAAGTRQLELLEPPRR